MKKKLLALLLTGAMVLSLAACGADAGTADSAADATETQTETTETEETTEETAAAAETTDGAVTGTLKLGFIGPITGAAGQYGSLANYGAQIAVEELNALGNGLTIEYQPEDDVHDAETSVNAYNTLKDWNVQAIVGCVTTTPCIAVASEAYSDRVFMLTPSASSPKVTEDRDNVYQVCFSDPNQGSKSAEYISENNLATKVAVIYNNADAYSTGIYQTFVSEAENRGLEVVSTTTFTDDTTDFSVQVTDAKNAGAELVFLPIYYQPASLILSEMDKQGYEATVFGVDGMDGILGIEGFDTSLAEGVMLLTPFAADATDDATVSFVKKFNDKAGETPSQFAADAYDAVYTIVEALNAYAAKNGALDVTDLSAEELCDILISTISSDDFSVDGLTGAGMKWNASGEVNKSPKAVIIKDGVYVGM
ncbi:MAG: ABC transporter substrate-binding protein [Lachnospiraceae bacterium]|nr:ABC transporter substrate-binding protein [Lachnospiraceae bacterium]